MERIYDLVIIGSGPAGLSAAIYAERAKLDTVILEQNYISGGQVMNTYEVDNYPGLPGVSGMELSEQFKQHAQKMGAEIRRAGVREVKLNQPIKEIITEGDTFYAKTVIIATGATHRKLNIPGEEELAGMGVSYCATCDGAFFQNRVTAVVGGGDVAVEDAIFLARICKKVYVIHRRDALRATKVLQEKLFALENIEMVWDSTVEEIQGEDAVSGVQVKNRKTKELRKLPVDGVFIAVGIVPNTEPFKIELECDEDGYIKADESGVTNVAGVFVAGDVRTKTLRQIVTAASDGANAVNSVQRFLMENA